MWKIIVNCFTWHLFLLKTLWKISINCFTWYSFLMKTLWKSFVNWFTWHSFLKLIAENLCQKRKRNSDLILKSKLKDLSIIRADYLTACNRNRGDFRNRKLLVYEESSILAERTQFAFSATTVTGETLHDSAWGDFPKLQPFVVAHNFFLDFVCAIKPEAWNSQKAFY